jgi:phosphoserine phosphatase RsbU/P
VGARYRSAVAGGDIGGDFYDLFQTGRDTWAIVLGDVCGKGTEAAVVTGLARHTLRAATVHESEPSKILWLLNEAILRSDEDERFCTVVYARLELVGDGARLVLACGGHPLPVVLRAGGQVESVGVPGTLIGSLPDPDLADDEVELRPGDAVVLWTDGVTEATGPEGFFGADRLRALVESCAGLDADTIAGRIEEAVLDFEQGEPRDDVAVLVLRVAPAT